ncbi:M36 family metallopeptidase [Arenicella xantha]|uniref:Fungalysin metallopeptidase (M36) n=1 Tax=Arenicella xantha TaxID=644221 RepID=A0A395JRC5_9GAMM|nr:M36 family metallopeptidase [Arenicella xantha]RBP51250.1 fungalysin metallopeptidase (M36) [Arenicella xantha]
MNLSIPNPRLGSSIIISAICALIMSSNSAIAAITVESLEGLKSAPSILVLSKASASDLAMRTSLEAQLPGANASISLQQVAAVSLRNGGTVQKYTRRFHDIPIINDWAVVRLSPQQRIETISYHVSRPTSKLNVASRLWSLNEQAVLTKLVEYSTIQPTIQPQAHTLKRGWFKRDNTLLPAYTVSASQMLNGQPALFSLVISADNADLLAKYPLSHDLTAYTYNIYADGAPELPHQTPHGDVSPHATGAPSATPPSMFVAQSEFNITELSNTSNDPWLPDNATETVGNNADVFFNFTRDTDGVFDFFGDGYGPQYRIRGDAFDQDFRAPVTDNKLIFDYSPTDYQSDYNQPFDSISNPSAQQVEAINAQQVQAFYLANLMHDVFYDAGFTELAGNAQSSNYGRGGIEGDPLIVHINSFTFITTTEDGTSPVIHLGRSRGGSTAFDTSIFAHEWTHYMYRRLVNPNILIADNQSSAINEGWADVVGVLMSMKPNHLDNSNSLGFTSSYSLGGYFTQERRSETFPDPYFYGIRRLPYGSANPFTFGHIAHKAPLPANIEYSDYNGRATQNSQIHTAGEIWANAVLACFRDVLLQRPNIDFATKRNLLASYVVGAMANTPPNPTFLEARNALLSSIKQTSTSDFDACQIRFSNKGMGAEAIAPPRNSKTFAEVVESFSSASLHLSIVSSTLKDNIVSLDQDGILDQNETGQLVLNLQNTGFETISQASLSLVLPSSDYQVSSATPVQLTNLAPGQQAQIKLPLRLLHNRHFDLSNFAIAVNLSGSNPNWERDYNLVTQHRTHYDLATQTSTDAIGNEFDLTMRDWSLSRQSPQTYVDSKWQEVYGANNSVFELQEPVLGQEGYVSRAWESPWMQAIGSEVSLNFEHAFELTSGEALIEISENGIDWTPFDVTSNPYEDTSSSFPNLEPQHLTSLTIPNGTQFKIRFRIEALAPLRWQLDNISISGVAKQPFQEVLPEDGKDISGFCLPIKVANGAVVICL